MKMRLAKTTSSFNILNDIRRSCTDCVDDRKDTVYSVELRRLFISLSPQCLRFPLSIRVDSHSQYSTLKIMEI